MAEAEKSPLSRYVLASFALVPLSLAVAWISPSPLLVFGVAAVAIIPLAYTMGVATEELGKHAGPGIGGLLNATFGNATELIIALIALSSGLIEIVKASITGSIIGNILLVLGMSFFAGGLRHRKQTFSRTAAGLQVTMMALAVIGLVMPELYALFVFGGPGAPVPRSQLEQMSLWIAAILLTVYFAGLLFSLHTHKDVFNPVTPEGDPPRWGTRFALLVLFGATAVVALEAEVLVGALHAAVQQTGLNELFVGVVVVAIIGNAAEHGAAILLAWKNKMELSVGICTSSSTQIALFVAPILVVASFFLGSRMTLNFEPFELVSIALSVAIVSMIASDGESNWYEGVLLMMVYAIVAVGFFFHP